MAFLTRNIPEIFVNFLDKGIGYGGLFSFYFFLAHNNTGSCLYELFFLSLEIQISKNFELALLILVEGLRWWEAGLSDPANTPP